MATWDDVARLAGSLPEVETRGRDWRVKGKSFAWDRPLRKADLAELGDRAPEPPILAVWVTDEMEKQALVTSYQDLYFTTSHFDGYAIVLVRLASIGSDELQELLIESWLRRAPKRVADAYLESRREN